MDPFWVIVEGPDGSGKSYIAKECAHILASYGGSSPERPCILQKLSYDSPQEHYVCQPLQAMNLLGAHVVQDRGVLSGPVYEPIMRNDLERISWLDALVDNALLEGAVVLHVDADVGILQDRLEKRGDDYVSVDNLQDIQNGYAAIVERWVKNKGLLGRIDTTWDFPDRLALELILSSLEVSRRRR